MTRLFKSSTSHTKTSLEHMSPSLLRLSFILVPLPHCLCSLAATNLV